MDSDYWYERKHLKITREWCMPNKWTFQMKPIENLIMRTVTDPETTVDPFAGESRIAHVYNDMRESGMDAIEWLDQLLIERGEGWASCVLLDPPYSPRQLAEVYKSVGRSVNQQDTQTAKLYKECIERMTKLLKPGGKAIRCGWNSCGFGKTRGFEMNEILLVCCGGAHNDYIVTVETKHV